MPEERLPGGTAAHLFPGLPLRQGAKSEDIEAVERSIGRSLPEEYREFLRQSDGIEGFVGPSAYVQLWPVGDLPPMNESYGTSELVPGLILFGTDGGGVGYGLMQEGGDDRFVEVPLVGMSIDTVERLGSTFSGFVESLKADRFEAVHCTLDWYDGPILGLADFDGRPHVFEREAGADDRATPTFLLSPLAEDVFALAMEDWSIWLRWEAAFHEGRATTGTHPALPEDRARHEEIQGSLAGRLVVDHITAVRAKGEFKGQMVRWRVG